MKNQKKNEKLLRLVVSALIGTVGISAFSSVDAAGLAGSYLGDSGAASDELLTQRGISRYSEYTDAKIPDNNNENGEGIIDKSGSTSGNVGSLAIGYNAFTQQELSTAVGNTSFAGRDSNTLGAFALSEWQSNAIGTNAYANIDSNAIGYKAYADREAIAIGSNAVAGDASASTKPTGSIAIGANSQAKSASGIAIGSGAKANGAYTIVIGGNTSQNATARNSTVVGLNSSAGNWGAVFGASATAGSEAVAIGSGSIASASSVAIGGGETKAGMNSVAIGKETSAYGMGMFGTAIGNSSKVTQMYGTTLGNSAQSTVEGGVALGYYSQADRTKDTYGFLPTSTGGITLTQATIGQKPTSMAVEAFKSTQGAVSVGWSNNTRQIINVAAGSADTDAVNVAQLKALNKIVADNQLKYFSVNSTLTGNSTNNGATGTDAIAVGPNSSASGKFGTALGYNSAANGDSSIAINSGTATGTSAISIGALSEANGDAALAIGNQTKATAQSATALGIMAKAEGVQSLALGGVANAKGTHGVAIGSSSLATGIQDIAIGTSSKTLATTGNAIAIGLKATTVEGYSVAVGPTAKTQGVYSLALGYNAYTNGGYGTSVGTLSSAGSDSAVAVGSRAVSTGYQSTTIGSYARNLGYNSTAVGSNTTTNSANSLALGNNATANAIDGVALGSYSDVVTAARALGYDPTTGKTLASVSDISGLSDADRAIITNSSDAVATRKANYENAITAYSNRISALNNALTKARNDLQADNVTDEQKTELNTTISSLLTERSNLERAVEQARAAYRSNTDVQAYSKVISAWQATGGAVSVGDSEIGLTRQITNVAAGTVDTDAVNVAQLKALQKQVGAADSLIKVDQDGNTVIKGSDGNYYYPSDLNADGTAKDGATAVDENNLTLATDAGKSGLGLDKATNGTAGDGSDATQPISVADATTLIGGTTDADGNSNKDGLLDKSGASLNNIATVGDLQAVAQAGLNFTGDDSTNTVHRALSQTLKLNGGVDESTATSDSNFTTGNIAVVANDDEDGFNIKLAKNINLTSDGSVVFGDETTSPKLDANGLTVSETVKFTTNGISAGSQVITNVKAGTDDTDAANMAQLNELADKVGAADSLVKVDKDGNTVVKGSDGNYYHSDDLNDDGTIKDGATPVSENDLTLATDAGKSGLGLDKATSETNPITVENATNIVGGTTDADGNSNKDGLLDKSGTSLNNIATVGDLQVLAKAGLNFTGDDATNVHRSLSETLSITGGATPKDADGNSLLTENNIAVVANDDVDGLVIKLAKDINLTDKGSVSFGSEDSAPKFDATGLTISNTDPTKTVKFTTSGISAGGQVITNVAAGTAETDAVNMKQYNDLKTTSDGKMGSITVGTDKAGTETGITVDKTNSRIDIVGANTNITTTVKDRTVEVGLADNITLSENGSLQVGSDTTGTKINNSGITIKTDGEKDVSLTKDGLDNGGNRIKNVGAGVEDTDAANMKQLNEVKDTLNGRIDTLESKVGAADSLTKVDQNGNPVVSNGDKNYSTDSDGNAVDSNGNPLVKGDDGKYYPNGTTKDDNGNYVDGSGNPATEAPSSAETSLGSNADKSGLGLDKATDSTGPISTKDAKDVVGGLLDKSGTTLNNIATVEDLQALAKAGLDFGGDFGDDTHRSLSEKLSIKGGITDATKLTENNIGVVSNGSDTLTVKLAKDIDLGEDGSLTIGNSKLDDSGLTIKDENGNEGKYGADGSTLTDKDGNTNTSTATGNTITDKDGNTNTSTSTGNTITDKDGNTNTSTADGNTITDKDGNTNTSTAGGTTVSDKDGNSTSITPDGVTSKDSNGNSTTMGPGGIEMKDQNGNTIITINDKGLTTGDGSPTTINNGFDVPGTLTVTPGGTDSNGNTIEPKIDANGNRIQNVGNGVDPTDAVNVRQLNGVKSDLNNRMNAIGAHAAAMASLHPLDYKESDKLSFAAGMGSFHSKEAVAVGAFYRPNPDTMFSVGGSFGSSENMFNMGVSLRFGQDSGLSEKYKEAPLSTVAVLDDKVTSLEKENAALKGQLDEQREQIRLLMERLGM